MCAFVTSLVKLYVLVRRCWYGTIANTFSQYRGRGSQSLRLLLRAKHFLGCDDKCMLSVPSSTNDFYNSRWQSGGICQVLSTGAFSLSVHACLLPPHVRKYVFSTFFVTSVRLSCSRVCLLDVSRLLNLTLRHSVLVCSCHQDSLTPGETCLIR